MATCMRRVGAVVYCCRFWLLFKLPSLVIGRDSPPVWFLGDELLILDSVAVRAVATEIGPPRFTQLWAILTCSHVTGNSVTVMSETKSKGYIISP